MRTVKVFHLPLPRGICEKLRSEALKASRFIVLLAALFVILSQSTFSRQDPKSAYIKTCLRQILALIEKEYVDPVQEETILRGALGEMRKVDRTLSAGPCGDWSAFERTFDKSYAQNPSLASPLGEAAIRGMVKSLGDPYSLFLNASEWDYYRRAMNGETFAGIGVELSVKDGKLIITSPLAGSPAEKAGIEPGDEVVKVNRESLEGKDYYEVINSFDGPSGSTIMLSIRRGRGALKDIAVVRQNIRFEPVSAKIIGSKAGYIRIPYFGSKTDQEVKKALDALKSKKISRLIIDLRNNPGGDFNTGLRTGEFFVKGAPLVKVYKKGSRPQDKVPERSYDYAFNIAVLINEGSASAAEVLACALSDNKRGLLIGTPSFGKAVVQSLYQLPGDTALKLTTSRYLTPSGADINHKGLKPAIMVKSIYPMPDLTRDPVVLKAIEVLR